ncbi:MAG: hypothetical protein K2M95_05315 [Clostridiales bacterium]|nr:hypothetical protein [Clostridiales bacterium]
MGSMSLSSLMKNAENATKDVMKTVSAVIDEHSFVETDKFVSSNTDWGDAVGEGVVSGYARIGDHRVGLFATNPKVLKGSIGKTNAQKIAKIIHNATATAMPIVGILDTAGARFDEGIDAMEGYAVIFRALSEAYGTVPTALIVKGVNFGLSSYFCHVADLCIGLKDAQIASSSPLILAANTKEDPQKVCQSGSLAESAGIVTHVAANEKEAKTILQSFLSLLDAPLAQTKDDPNRTAKSECKTLDALIGEVFDKGSVLALRESYAKEVRTGFARLDGVAVGYVGIDGKLTTAGAGKVCELLNTCESFDLPVINLVNCDGVLTSLATDGAVIREIADMMFAYNSVSVPKLALIYGNAIGLGYTAFAAKACVDYAIAWENAKIGTVSGEAAAQLLYKEELAVAPDKEKAAQKIAKAYSEENLSAPVVAAKGYLDNVIDPVLSRPYLIAALQTFIAE